MSLTIVTFQFYLYRTVKPFFVLASAALYKMGMTLLRIEAIKWQDYHIAVTQKSSRQQVPDFQSPCPRTLMNIYRLFTSANYVKY